MTIPSIRIRSDISQIVRTSSGDAKSAFLRFVVRELNLLTVINDDSSSFHGRSSVPSVRTRIFNPNRFFLRTRLSRSRGNFVRVLSRESRQESSTRVARRRET